MPWCVVPSPLLSTGNSCWIRSFLAMEIQHQARSSSNFAATGLHAKMPHYPANGDVAAANKMLDDAGYKKDSDGVRMKAMFDLIPYGEDWKRGGQYIQQVLGEIGIQVELRYEDVPTWLKRIYHNYDFEMNLNYFYQLADPVLGVHRHYGTNMIRKGTHFVNSSR